MLLPVIVKSVLIDWFFLWIKFFCFFACMLVIFIGYQTLWILTCWMLGILVSLPIFLSFILGHSYATWKQFDPLSSCFWDSVGETGAVFSLGLIFLCYWGKTLLSSYPVTCELRGFPGWLVGTHYSQPCVSSSIVITNIFRFFLPWPKVVSSHT